MFDGTLVKVNARHMSSLMTKRPRIPGDHHWDTNDDENRTDRGN